MQLVKMCLALYTFKLLSGIILLENRDSFSIMSRLRAQFIDKGHSTLSSLA